VAGSRFSDRLPADDPHEQASHFAKFALSEEFTPEHEVAGRIGAFFQEFQLRCSFC
jgi:hypothetical protein